MPRFIIQDVPYSIYINGTDGVANNALSCVNSATLNPTGAVTVGSWFCPVGDRKAFVLFDNSDSGSTFSYFLIVNANGSFSWFSTIGAVSRNITGASSQRVRWNEWNFMQATYTGSAVRLFLNGSQLTEEITGISGTLGTNTGRMRMGAYFSGGASLTMRGFFSAPRLYSVGCTLTEHQDRYYRGVTSSALQAGLLLDGTLSEGSGGTSADASGNGNTIILGASASWSPFSPSKGYSQASGRVQASGLVQASGRVQIT